MDHAQTSAVAHRWHPVAAPVSDENLQTLLVRIGLPQRGSILDLGCGRGEWLLRALESVPGARGVGVDTSGPALREARRSADRRGVADRVRLEEADAATWTDSATWAAGRDGDPNGDGDGDGDGDEAGREGGYDVVLCVGATHAFGGLRATLAAIRRHLRPGGRVLLGEGFWEGAPDAATLAALGAEPGELPDLAGLVDAAGQAGFEPGYGHVSTAAEWDHYEWCWTGALAEWALTEAPDADRAEALELARDHRRNWLAGYRDRLGFLTVVLRDTGTPARARPGTPA